jgi:phage protein D
MGLMDISPATRIVANDQDITAAISDRFRSLHLSDSAGLESDTLEIVLADHDPLQPIKMPPTGAELEVFLGYDGSATRMGLFVCDEIEFTGWPGTMTIRARAATYEATPKGKKDLQTQKSRAWPKDTTISAMVGKIAQEHGMQPAVAKSMASIKLPRQDQTSESDLSFLIRVMKKYGGVVKPAGGKLLVAKRGESKTIGGDELPVVTMRPTDVGTWTCRKSTKEGKGTVVAFYRDTKQSKRVEVTVGSGDPVRRLRHASTNAENAKAAAQAELDKRERGQVTFSATMEGRPDLVAEGRLVLEGFREGVAGTWLLSKVEHVLDEQGYRCNIEAEKPTEAETSE